MMEFTFVHVTSMETLHVHCAEKAYKFLLGGNRDSMTPGYAPAGAMIAR